MKKNKNKILLIILSCLSICKPVQAINEYVVITLTALGGSIIGMGASACVVGSAIMCYTKCYPFLAHKWLTCYQKCTRRAAPAPQNEQSSQITNSANIMDEERAIPIPLDRQSLQQNESDDGQTGPAQNLQSTQESESNEG